MAALYIATDVAISWIPLGFANANSGNDEDWILFTMTLPAIARTPKELKQLLAAGSGSIGFVPTMGALHAGHSALIAAARKECERVVASIFVNPAQFGPSEDLSRYPRTEEADMERLGQDGCDIVFIPVAEAIYPPGFSTFVEVGELSDVLDGLYRPGHFRGVATVVSILLNLVMPQKAFFGEKDYQQLVIIRRMVHDLAMPVEIIGIPTVREADGLALSSRNRYLSKDEREIAPELYRTLNNACEDIREGHPLTDVVGNASSSLLTSGFSRIDYLAAHDAATLKPLYNKSIINMRLFAAVWLSTTRLIDNIAV